MGYTVGAWAFVIGAEGEAGRPVGVVLEELLARVGAVLRRSGRLTSRVTTVGDLVMDEEATLATRGADPSTSPRGSGTDL